jgi:basic membrane protein A and related proteins
LKKTLKFVAVFAAAALAFGVSAPSANAAATKACLALDTGGVDDKSFNALAWSGAQQAAKANTSVTVKYLAATSDADYAPNIKKLIDEGCNVIIGVGYLINPAIVAAAKDNPKINFGIVDQDGEDHGPAGDQYPGKTYPNLKGITFSTNQAAFQAGYLAAGITKTGKVATFGGANIPPVTIFMDGFAKGVAYYNKVKGKKVVCLGWDTVKQDGLMVGNFSDMAKSLQYSISFEQQGADVILPVGGNLGSSTATNALKTKKSVVIWVDKDGFIAAPEYSKVMLTSIMKSVDLSVKTTILEQASGKFSNTKYDGTLQNAGVSLAPYHDLIRMVPSALRTEVSKLGNDIRSGKVSVK